MERVDSKPYPQLWEWEDAPQDLVQRARDYVRDRLDRADQTLAELIGQPLSSWVAEAQSFVRTHPVRSAAIVLGIGYILGKVVLRR